MRAEVTLFELVLVVLILIGAFAVFFPRFAYETRWEEALLLLKGRDVILTAERIGKLYEYSFNFSALSDFLNRVLPREVLIYLPAVEGTIKGRIHIACNCTDKETKTIIDWLTGPQGKAPVRANERDMEFYVCRTHLEELNPCLSERADLLIIWGRQSLATKHRDLLKGHLERGNGILQIRDFSGAADMDIVQQEIFGLSWVGTFSPQQYDEFQKPENVKKIVYGPWKYFHHIPINLEANATGGGNFTFRQNTYTFQIISPTSISIAGQIINVGNFFQLAGYNFYLSYIKDNAAIGISFKPEYNFTDFLRIDDSAYSIQPGDGNWERVPLVARPQNLPVVILNVTPIARVAWMANFSEGGVGDDERLLFISLLLWASNQRQMWLRDIVGLTEYLKTAYSISYINTKNKDMFEVYKFKLGIGYPYG